MYRLGYARSIAQHSLLLALLLSAAAQAEGLFAPAVFITAPEQTRTQALSTRSGLEKAVLQSAAADRQLPANRNTGQWLSQSVTPPGSPAPLLPRLRF
jgi:hypothetical protein